MCECGCAEQMMPRFRFKGPDGFVYAVGIDPGCVDCDGPAGVILYRLTEEQVAEGGDWNPRGDLMELPWGSRGNWSELYIPIIGQMSLRKALGEVMDEFDAEEAGRTYRAAASEEIGRFMEQCAAARQPEEGNER